MPANWDWQTAILQVMGFEDAHAVSDGIKCYPTPITTNTYNIWDPVRDVEAVLHLSSNRTILSAYQLSIEMTTPHFVVTSLEMDGFHYNTAAFLQGNNAFLGLHGAMARNIYAGPHYFSIQYRTSTGLSFTDCKENYSRNRNLYAMMLPPSCTATVINPKTSFSLKNAGWVLVITCNAT